MPTHPLPQADLSPVQRIDLCRVVETAVLALAHRIEESSATVRQRLRQRLLGSGDVCLEETADQLLANHGFSTKFLDHTLSKARIELRRCLSATDGDQRHRTEDLAARHYHASIDEQGEWRRLYEELEPLLLEAFRQWKEEGFTRRDLQEIGNGSTVAELL